VSEADPTAPTMPRTLRRARAEGHWLASGLPVHLFRLAGIYGPGPGRSALAAARAGTARRIVKPGQVFCRIHVDDIVQVLRASMARPNPGAIYNIADDEPARVFEILPALAEAAGAKPPRRVPRWLGRLAAGEVGVVMMTELRGVSNEKAKRDLGWKLRYPSWRQGFHEGLG
jgi:nucleoside-diphosphate-sugar epimerase